MKRTFPAALGLLLVLASCQDALIDPFESEAHYFTVFGYLDLTETAHALRVVPVSRLPERIETLDDPLASIDAEVTTTDLTTGQVTRWTHHLERLTDDTYGHIFRANFPVNEGRTYRLDVRRSDGATTTAEVFVPSSTTLPAPVLGAVEGEGRLRQEVVLPEIASPWNVQVHYHIPLGEVIRVPVDYYRSGTRTADGGWRFTINLSDDADAVNAYLDEEFNEFQTFELIAMSVTLRVLDERWDPPGGLFEPEILAQPRAFTNVENGYGFFGALGVYLHVWSVEADLAHALGFQQRAIRKKAVAHR